MGRKIDTISQTINLTGARESDELVLANDDGSILRCLALALFLDIDVQAPAAGIFTAAASDICTKTGHGYQSGLKGDTSTDGVLPGGLAAQTYYVIRLDADTFKLASSYANAIAAIPIAVDITNAGTGNHTFTPAALSGATWKLQVSPDAIGSAWFDYAAATNITVDAKSITEKANPPYKRAKIVYAATAGQAIISQKFVADRVLNY